MESFPRMRPVISPNISLSMGPKNHPEETDVQTKHPELLPPLGKLSPEMEELTDRALEARLQAVNIVPKFDDGTSLWDRPFKR